MIIKGVGTFMAKRLLENGGAEVVTLGTLQSLRIDLNTEIEDIFGGDGLFSIDTLVRSKSIEITATDAKFDLAALQLMMGSSLKTGVQDTLWVLGEQGELVAGLSGIADVAKFTPRFADTAVGDFAVRLKDSNRLLKTVAFSTGVEPGVGEVMINPSTGEIICAEAMVGSEIVFNYKRSETVDMVEILADEVPFPVHVVHHGSFLQKDGTYQGVETELYAARARGTFSIDAQRAAASASAVTLTVLDPERVDGKLGTIKRYTSTSRV